MKIARSDLLRQLPPEYSVDLLPEIQTALKQNNKKVFVLDDDPTGTQSVYGISVLTKWDTDLLVSILLESEPVVYLLTNSRSLPLEQAQALNREIVANIKKASFLTGREFVLVSRSDSTLRGHFPGEVEGMIENLTDDINGILIIPFYYEGGRITLNDIHYVAENDFLIPAAETEYAKDNMFGYRSSNLRDWVSEKTGGRVNSEDVVSISLELIRIGGPEAVTERLLGLINGQICIVNAVTYRDLEVFVTGLLRAEANGKRFIYRTAASFVRVRTGLSPKPLLSADELDVVSSRAGGLVIAGSYTQNSSVQIAALQAFPCLISLEVDVQKLLDPNNRIEEIRRVITETNKGIYEGWDVLIFTSRELVKGDSPSDSLSIGQTISEALVQIVKRINLRPSWIIAKGGITSSDIATKSLGIVRAEVMGQILSGVSVWQAGGESKWPGLVYVVFPGNVGESGALVEIVKVLRSAKVVDP
jgi:uncharacterized protein YgbK (DUF1537 family)